MADGSIIIDTKLNITGAKRDMKELTSSINETQTQMDLLVDKFIESKRHIKNLSDKDLDRMVNNFKQSNAEYQGLVAKQKELTAGVKQYEKALTGTTIASTKVTTNFSGISKAITRGVKSLARFSLALLGMVGISGIISSSIREWGESGNAEAQQLQANIKQLKSAIGASLAPAVNAVLNMFFKALAVVNALLKAFTGINFLAKATAKSTGQTAKNTKGALASFDELNVLPTSENEGGSSTPSANLEEMSTQFDDVANKVKGVIESITAPLETALEPFINFTGGNLSEFYNDVLVPIGEWAINTALPTFFEFLASVFEILTTVLEGIKPLFDWLWDNFLEPVGKWVADKFIEALGFIADKLSDLSDWIKENKSTVENIIIVIGSFAAAWALVTGALTLWNIAVGVWNTIGVIATAVTTGFGAAVALLTSPITIVILIIGALIAIILLLIKNWDKVKEVASNVWEKIKETWGNVKEWFSEKVFKPLKDMFEKYIKPLFTKKYWLDKFNAIKEGIKETFNGVITIVENAINFIIEKINKLSWDIPDWVPGIGGGTFGFDFDPIKIPRLAKGGIAYQPTQAIIGEAGREAVLPLENNTEWMDDLAERISLNQNVNIEFTGSLSQLARVLNPVIKKEQTRAGARLIGGAV